MANPNEISESSAITPIGNPMVTIRNNNYVVPFNVKLNGKNYNTRSKMIMLHAPGEGKRGYLTRKVTHVIEEDPGFDARCIKDSTVKVWMFKTMEHDLVELFLKFLTAKDVWDNIALTYYDAPNEPQIYELCYKATRITSDNRHVSIYFAELKTVWLELD